MGLLEQRSRMEVTPTIIEVQIGCQNGANRRPPDSKSIQNDIKTVTESGHEYRNGNISNCLPQHKSDLASRVHILAFSYAGRRCVPESIRTLAAHSSAHHAVVRRMNSLRVSTYHGVPLRKPPVNLP